MKANRWLRYALLLGVMVLGVWAFARSAAPSAEMVARQQAVVALAPGLNVPGATADAMQAAAARQADAPAVVQAVTAAPVIIDLQKVPRTADLPPSELERYLSGQIDLGAPESAYSEAILADARARALAAGPDRYLRNGPSTDLGLDFQPLGVRFDAITYTDSQAGVPPDDTLTVGTDHVVVAVNTSMAVYDKTGELLVAPTRFESIWGEACGFGSQDQLLFDPFVTYDEQANRYIIGITAAYIGGDGNPTNQGYMCILVSQADDATGNFYGYSFNCNPGSGFLNPPYFCDYPQIGIGRDALYASSNMFDFTLIPLYARAHVYAMDKNAMYAGAPTAYSKVNVGSLFNIQISLEPADMHGFNFGGWAPQGEPHYFVNSNIPVLGAETSIKVWEFRSPLTNPSFVQVATLSTDPYNLPVTSPQLGGPGLQANDTRIQDVEYWGETLWASHTIACNPGSGTVNCARYYEIDVSGASPTLAQQGTKANNGVYRSFPNVAVDRCGNMVMTYSEMTSSTYPQWRGAGRLASDAPGALRGNALIKASQSPYNAYDPTPHRWGDYHAATIDPDGSTIWAIGEFALDQADADWATTVASWTFPNCQP